MTRITKREAIQRFEAGETIILCPCKLRPGFPFSSEYVVLGQDAKKWIAVSTSKARAWERMLSNWAFYNCCWETGYYAHYYKD